MDWERSRNNIRSQQVPDRLEPIGISRTVPIHDRAKKWLCISYPHSGLLLLAALSVTRSRVVREKVRMLPHGDIAMYLR
jgi:hypothetical protein